MGHQVVDPMSLTCSALQRKISPDPIAKEELAITILNRVSVYISKAADSLP
jgi:hypothetical protein